MKNLHDWLEYQSKINIKEIDLSLSRIYEVKRRLNFKQPEIEIFLVAGTNGKGSTTHLIQSILMNKGLNVGAYTSPHLNDYNERVTFNNQNIEDKTLIESFMRIEESRGKVPLTYFEFGTLAAFLALSSKPCDAWVIEVGLGGRLDATNILHPSISIITSISLDHQDWLGEDIDSIAKEKAGIIKNKTPCISSAKNAFKVIRDKAKKSNADLYEVDRDFSMNKSKNGYVWSFRDDLKYRNISIPDHWGQGEINNLSSSLAAINVCEEKLLPTSDKLNSIVSDFSLPGRFQIMDKGIPWILDVAHNYESALNFSQRLNSLEISGDILMIFGIMGDKDIENIIKIFKNRIRDWMVTSLESSRSLSTAEISKFLRGENILNIIKSDNPNQAFEEAKKLSHMYDAIIVTGSFELVGPAIKWLERPE